METGSLMEWNEQRWECQLNNNNNKKPQKTKPNTSKWRSPSLWNEAPNQSGGNLTIQDVSRTLYQACRFTQLEFPPHSHFSLHLHFEHLRIFGSCLGQLQKSPYHKSQQICLKEGSQPEHAQPLWKCLLSETPDQCSNVPLKIAWC